jgi:hypothetical protein
MAQRMALTVSPFGALEVVSLKQAVGLHVAEYRLDAVASAHLAAEGG